MREIEEGCRSPRVRFKDGNENDVDSVNEVFDVRHNMQSANHNDIDMSFHHQRAYRNYSPNNSGPHNTSQYSPKYNHQNVSPTYSTNSMENHTQLVKQTSIFGELKFLEESNSNILIELRECQDSNYVLTEELRRAQRSNINVLDELQACQTANMVLRNELQRLEIENTKVSRDLDKYKKANKMLKEDIKEMKTRHWKRRDSTRALREKAKDIITQYGTSDSKGISSLKEAIDSFAESVETESLNGYLPTDSDSMSERQSSNSDIEDADSINHTPRVRGRREFVRSQSNEQPRYHEERNGLFGRKKLANMAGDQRGPQQQQQQPPQRDQPPRVLGRRAGSLENLLEIDRQSIQNGNMQRIPNGYQNGNHPVTPSSMRKSSNQRMTPSPKSGKGNSLSSLSEPCNIPDIIIDSTPCTHNNHQHNHNNNVLDHFNVLSKQLTNIHLAEQDDSNIFKNSFLNKNKESDDLLFLPRKTLCACPIKKCTHRIHGSFEVAINKV